MNDMQSVSDPNNRYDNVERIETPVEPIEIGQWYWTTTADWEGDRETWLGCVTEVGSNFLRVESPQGHTTKVHVNQFHDILVREHDPHHYIERKIAECRQEGDRLLTEIKAVTARLGMEQQTFLGHKRAPESNRALATLSGSEDPRAYQDELQRAKEETLPELFDQVERNNKELTTWMKAEAIPLKALAGSLDGLIETINGRIFNVSLYAGLLEDVHTITEGEPAPMGSKLHLLQRKLYMDEESLLAIADGGIGFDHIEQFDEWLIQPDNLDRIMPFERCMVCFQVRRNDKDYHWDGTMAGAFAIADKKRADKSTFLYIRNGENIHCLGSDLEFGEFLFPAAGTFDPTGPMVMKTSSCDEVMFMSLSEYDERCKYYRGWQIQHAKEVEEREAWQREHMGPEPQEHHFVGNDDDTVTYHNPGTAEEEHGEYNTPEITESMAVTEIITWQDTQKEQKSKSGTITIGGHGAPTKEEWGKHPALCAYRWRYNIWRDTWDRMPYGGFFHDNRSCDFEPRNWKPFDSTNVDYDLGTKEIAKQVEHYNRIALLIQGIYDRSMLLHPHPPVRLYQPGGFEEAVELVFDGTGVLHNGEAPDIEAYMAANNAAINADSVLMGQYNKWHEAEYKKPRNWRWWGGERHFSLPNGNDGPGKVSHLLTFMPKAGKAVFSWTRYRQTDDYLRGKRWGDPIYACFTCSVDGLFNLSAYKPGDMRQFYEDPRTRSRYLMWAERFIIAEKYHRGQITPDQPVHKANLQ